MFSNIVQIIEPFMYFIYTAKRNKENTSFPYFLWAFFVSRVCTAHEQSSKKLRERYVFFISLSSVHWVVKYPKPFCFHFDYLWHTAHEYHNPNITIYLYITSEARVVWSLEWNFSGGAVSDSDQWLFGRIWHLLLPMIFFRQYSILFFKCLCTFVIMWLTH